MQLVVLANESSKTELLSNGAANEVEIIWIKTAGEFKQHETAHGFIDLIFEPEERRIALLKSFSSRPVIINSVITTLHEIDAPFIRINAWPGFLNRPVIEASYNNQNIKQHAEKIFSSLNKKTEWVADEPGFITTRVLAMIINEAWFALSENVSTKQEIDTAMKLGTNYPYGPFEWCNKIGIKNIYGLLNKLSENNARYKPAPLLEKEAIVYVSYFKY